MTNRAWWNTSSREHRYLLLQGKIEQNSYKLFKVHSPHLLSFSPFTYETEKTFVISQARICLPWCAVPALSSCEGTSLKQILQEITSAPWQTRVHVHRAEGLQVGASPGGLVWEPWLSYHSAVLCSCFPPYIGASASILEMPSLISQTILKS